MLNSKVEAALDANRHKITRLDERIEKLRAKQDTVREQLRDKLNTIRYALFARRREIHRRIEELKAESAEVDLQIDEIDELNI